MIHPFDGPISYPWERSETSALFDVLVRDVAEKPRIDMLFKAAAPGLAPLDLDRPSVEIWKDALEFVATAGSLLRLCRDLAALPGLPRVTAAARTVLDARPAVERRIAGNGRLILDRSPLRGLLAQLAAEDGPMKVVLVRGDPKTGKTWGRHLFEQMARDRGADVTYIYSGTVATAAMVIDKLFTALQAPDLMPEQDSSEPAWYQQVCNRLAAAADRRGKPLWIAVDDLGVGPDRVTPLMAPEIRSFFDQFVRHMLDPAVNRWFRLMLINYPDGREPTQWESEVWAEDRTDGDLRAEHVVELLREWAADHNKQLVEDELLAHSAQVIALADAPGAGTADVCRLRRIHDTLKKTIDDLARTPA